MGRELYFLAFILAATVTVVGCGQGAEPHGITSREAVRRTAEEAGGEFRLARGDTAVEKRLFPGAGVQVGDTVIHEGWYPSDPVRR